MSWIKRYRPLEIKLINLDPKMKITGNLLVILKYKIKNKNVHKSRNVKMIETLTKFINLNDKTSKIDSWTKKKQIKINLIHEFWIYKISLPIKNRFWKK